MAFRSTVATARLRATSTDSSFPAYFFAVLPERFPARSATNSFPRARFPDAGEFIIRDPLPVSVPVRPADSLALLLFGTFRSRDRVRR
jgi:hypothetical protein